MTVTPLLTVQEHLMYAPISFHTPGWVMCLMAQATMIDTVTSTTGGCDTIRTLNLTVTPIVNGDEKL